MEDTLVNPFLNKRIRMMEGTQLTGNHPPSGKPRRTPHIEPFILELAQLISGVGYHAAADHTF